MRVLRLVSALLCLLVAPLSWAGEIHDAAEQGDLAKVEALLAKQPSLLMARNERGLTPLHLAATKSPDVVRLLLARKADPNAASSNGTMPLHVAARFDQLEVAELLLAAKADPNGRTKRGETALHQAVYRARSALIGLLLEKGADVNAVDVEGNTPLHMAAMWNAKDAVPLLLAKQANVNAQAKNGDTPLHATLTFVSEELKSFGSLDAARLLLEAKADTSLRNAAGLTPLALARQKGAQPMVELLKQSGAGE